MAGPVGRLRTTRTLVASLLAASLVTITIDYRAGDAGPVAFLSSALVALIAPLQQGVSSVTGPVGGFVGTLIHLPGIRRDNATLRDRVAELERELATTSSDARRLAELEALLGVRDQLGGEGTTLAAQVIANGISDLEWTIQIDRGSSSGVRVGMPVVASAGLVGRVVRVAPNASVVRLVLDPRAAVVGRFGSSGTTGVVSGQGDRDLRMSFLDPQAVVTADDTVVTAGYKVVGGEPAFPAGILIGQVARVKPDPAGLETYVTIRPAVDFSTLDVVLVVLSTGTTETA
ncbi:MAG: rod shape-determining protein MreC [Actinomycetota bacterium]